MFIDRLGSSEMNDSIVGDLMEEYQLGRSRLWYWWQLLTAIAVGLFRELRGQKLLALRALINGWGILYIFMASFVSHSFSGRDCPSGGLPSWRCCPLSGAISSSQIRHSAIPISPGCFHRLSPRWSADAAFRPSPAW